MFGAYVSTFENHQNPLQSHLSGSLLWCEKIEIYLRGAACKDGMVSNHCHSRDTVNGRYPAPPGIYKTLQINANNGINYQPQLVSRISSINSISHIDLSRSYSKIRRPEIVLCVFCPTAWPVSRGKISEFSTSFVNGIHPIASLQKRKITSLNSGVRSSPWFPLQKKTFLTESYQGCHPWRHCI